MLHRIHRVLTKISDKRDSSAPQSTATECYEFIDEQYSDVDKEAEIILDGCSAKTLSSKKGPSIEPIELRENEYHSQDLEQDRGWRQENVAG